MQNLKPTFTTLFCFFALTFSLQAQDLIVTTEGDSLNCKITKVKPDYIYFSIKQNEGIHNTLMPTTQIKEYKYNFYSTSEIPSSAKITGPKDFPRFRAALSGGYSTRLAKVSDNIPDDFQDYIKDLKSGISYGLDVSYYWSKKSGIGLRYDIYKSKNEIEDIYVTLPDGSYQYGNLSDDITINFIGPFYSSRFLTANKKNSMFLNVGLGYVGYKDEAVIITDFTFTGGTAGILLDLGYDIGLSKTLALGFQISYMGGALSQYELSDGQNTETIELDSDNYEGLSRINLSVGLRFIK